MNESGDKDERRKSPSHTTGSLNLESELDCELDLELSRPQKM